MVAAAALTGVVGMSLRAVAVAGAGVLKVASSLCTGVVRRGVWVWHARVSGRSHGLGGGDRPTAR